MADKTDTANLQPLRVGDAGIPVDLSVLSLPLMLVVKLLCPQLLSSSWFGLLLGELVQYAVALPVCWWIAKVQTHRSAL